MRDPQSGAPEDTCVLTQPPLNSPKKLGSSSQGSAKQCVRCMRMCTYVTAGLLGGFAVAQKALVPYVCLSLHVFWASFVSVKVDICGSV